MERWFRNIGYVFLAVLAATTLIGCGDDNNDGPDSSGPPSFTVKDTAGAAVAGATVYAIPAADVAEMGTVPLVVSAGNYTTSSLAADEPLEDLINGNYIPASGGVAVYRKAVTDAGGKVSLAGLPTGAADTFFIYVKPDAADTGHLPGGSLCRNAVSGSSLSDRTTNITVSTTPSASATFVGTSVCLACHSDYEAEKQTLHKLGIMAPGSPSGLQDLAKFGPSEGVHNFGAGMAKFTAGDSTSGGTTIWFYDYDGTRKFDKFKTLESAPTGTVYATVRTYKDTGDNKYKMQFKNIINPADPNATMTFDVVLTYGGGLYKQRYMTRVPGYEAIYMLPLQFNPAGSDSSTDRVRKVWRDYHLDWWWNAGTSTFRTVPAAANSFDFQCAPCHYNGYSVTQNVGGEYVATAAADYFGEMHPSGAQMELNIGCEACHGPGSEHVAANGNGASIVSPSNITPEREAMLCGQCHSRPQGNDSFNIRKDSPLNQQNKMMVAGTSRADFLAANTTRHDASDAAGDYWADKKHSKSHHQQYTDMIQSSKYRNGSMLMTCTSCHDPHKPGSDRHQLTGAGDNSLCASCHTSVNAVSHMTVKTGYSMGTGAECMSCHNPKTSSSGAGLSATNPFVGASNTRYFKGDISSHLFDVPMRSAISTTNTMPIPFTDRCGICHSGSGL